ncbi:hypothetical protein SDC9_43470 [bioreactor metagenome]|uniref:Uncharacterized protein n=1 Tax=bioreactor metagenome TaxID=1076179 RepID=A0A644W0R6_9ZZZZ
MERLFRQGLDDLAEVPGEDDGADGDRGEPSHEHLGQEMAHAVLLLFRVGASRRGDLVGDDEGRREAEEAGDGDGRRHGPGVSEDLRGEEGGSDDSDEGDAEADHQRVDQGAYQFRCGLGKADPDEDQAEEHGVAHGVGLVKDLVLQEAGLVEHDAHDEGHDELVELQVRQSGAENHGVVVLGGEKGHPADDGGLGKKDEGSLHGLGECREQPDARYLGIALGSFPRLCFLRLAAAELREKALCLRLEAEGGDGKADEILQNKKKGGEDGEVLEPDLLGGFRHDDGGHDAAGDGTGRCEGHFTAEDWAGDEEKADRKGHETNKGDDDRLPFLFDVPEFHKGSHVDKNDGKTDRGEGNGSRRLEDGLGEAVPEPEKEDEARDKDHGEDGLCLVGHDIADGVADHNEHQHARGNVGGIGQTEMFEETHSIPPAPQKKSRLEKYTPLLRMFPEPFRSLPLSYCSRTTSSSILAFSELLTGHTLSTS